MFISIGFYPDFEEEVKKHFVGDEKMINDFQREITKGFATMLELTRNQIRAVFSREGVLYVDVAFLIILEKTKFHVEIFAIPIKDAVPTEEDHLILLFPLLEKEIIIPFPNPINLKYASHGNACAMDGGQRLAADFGRDGIPTEMKKIIGEVSRVFRKAISPKYYPYPNWINV